MIVYFSYNFETTYSQQWFISLKTINFVTIVHCVLKYSLIDERRHWKETLQMQLCDLSEDPSTKQFHEPFDDTVERGPTNVTSAILHPSRQAI